MSLADGGHLTHGMSLNLSGKWFRVVSYGLDAIGANRLRRIERLAHEHRAQAHHRGRFRVLPAHRLFALFGQVAKEVGAYLMVDMAHYAGLIAAGVYPSPLPFADVVTSTTHKSLRGPRGGFVLMQRRRRSPSA